MTDDQTTSRKQPEKSSEDTSFGTTLLQFFLIPALVVFACVGAVVFVMTSLSAIERHQAALEARD